MPSSRYLRSHQIAALVRVGDSCIPGESGAPSFRALGCVRHVDRVLENIDRADRLSLQALLSVLWVCPTAVHRGLLRWAAGSFDGRGPLGPLLRQLDYGLRGLVLTLYFSEWSQTERMAGGLGEAARSR
jgi:hypothetical protein